MHLKSIQPKQKKCRVCGNSFTPWNSLQIVCSTPCAIVKAKADNLKKLKEVSKIEKAVLRDKLTNYKDFLQKDVQKISRLIDYGLRGLHESKNDIGDIQGGHIYSKKQNEQMRFNLHVIHRQGAKSNMALIYDEEMRDALKAEYGNEYFEFIKSLKQQPLPQIKQHEYKEYHFRALAVIKRLDLTFTHYSKKERLELRNEINAELGIYPSKYSQFKFAY